MENAVLDAPVEKLACELAKSPSEVLSLAVWMVSLQTDLELADGK